MGMISDGSARVVEGLKNRTGTGGRGSFISSYQDEVSFSGMIPFHAGLKTYSVVFVAQTSSSNRPTHLGRQGRQKLISQSVHLWSS